MTGRAAAGEVAGGDAAGAAGAVAVAVRSFTIPPAAPSR